MMHFHLAAAYEQSGRNAEAAARYEIFLNIWNNADSSIPEIAEAANRLKAIRTEI